MMGFDLTRRGFLGLLGIGAAAIAAEELIPFNRVWSIPSNVRIANIAETAAITGGSNPLLTIDMITREALRILKNKLTFTSALPKTASPQTQIHVTIPSESSLYQQSLDSYSKSILEPAMASIGEEIKFHKIDRFKELDLPMCADMAARVTDKANGLSLRMMRAFDITNGNYVTRFDVASS